MRSHDQFGLLLLGEMAAVDVQADDVGDRIADAVVLVDIAAERMPARSIASRRLRPSSRMNSSCLPVCWKMIGCFRPFALMSSPSFVKLLVRHHGEGVGGGMAVQF